MTTAGSPCWGRPRKDQPQASGTQGRSRYATGKSGKGGGGGGGAQWKRAWRGEYKARGDGSASVRGPTKGECRWRRWSEPPAKAWARRVVPAAAGPLQATNAGARGRGGRSLPHYSDTISATGPCLSSPMPASVIRIQRSAATDVGRARPPRRPTRPSPRRAPGWRHGDGHGHPTGVTPTVPAVVRRRPTPLPASPPPPARRCRRHGRRPSAERSAAPPARRATPAPRRAVDVAAAHGCRGDAAAAAVGAAADRPRGRRQRPLARGRGVPPPPPAVHLPPVTGGRAGRRPTLVAARAAGAPAAGVPAAGRCCGRPPRAARRLGERRVHPHRRGEGRLADAGGVAAAAAGMVAAVGAAAPAVALQTRGGADRVAMRTQRARGVGGSSPAPRRMLRGGLSASAPPPHGADAGGAHGGHAAGGRSSGGGGGGMWRGWGNVRLAHVGRCARGNSPPRHAAQQ